MANLKKDVVATPSVPVQAPESLSTVGTFRFAGNLFVTRLTSVRTGKAYLALRIDLGYAVRTISVEPASIAEWLGVAVAQIERLAVGEALLVFSSDSALSSVSSENPA